MTNYCDYGHEEEQDVKVLPLEYGGSKIVCRHHYLKEMDYRKTVGGKLVSWDHLQGYPDKGR